MAEFYGYVLEIDENKTPDFAPPADEEVSAYVQHFDLPDEAFGEVRTALESSLDKVKIALTDGSPRECQFLTIRGRRCLVAGGVSGAKGSELADALGDLDDANMLDRVGLRWPPTIDE